MSTRPPVPTPTAKDFARDFPEMAAGMRQYVNDLVAGKERLNFQAREPQMIRRRSNSLESRRLEQGAVELTEQMEAQGWTPAVVVNLNPWPIKVNGVLHNEILPVCPSAAEWRQMGKSGKPYAYVILDRYEQDTRDRGDGNWTCHPFVPLQLARDYLKECQVTEWGGIFFYPGRALPDDPYLPEELKQLIEREWDAAEKALVKWARKMFRSAEAVAKKPGADMMLIGDRERWAAMWLYDNGYLPKGLPPWVTEIGEQSAQQKECPSCRNKVDASAILCGHGRCTYVFDPRKAYLDGLIDDVHPSLRRLTREDLDALDLQHVKSISHLRGVAAIVPTTPVQVADDVDKFAAGELPEDELTEEELEALTRPPDASAKAAEAAVAEAESKEKPSQTPPPAPRKPEARKPAPKSPQQKKAEESLE